MLAALSLVLLLSPATATAATTFADVEPIFRKNCVMCHAGQAAPLGLRLDSLAGVLDGSSRGSVVEAGKPQASELLRRVKGISQPRMPMTGPPFLGDEAVATIEAWIDGGLLAGETDAPAPAVATAARPGADGRVDYLDVAPIFAARCTKCHTENGLMGPAPEGFRLTSLAATLDASDRARVVPGNAGASELVRRIRGQALPRMPLDGPPYLAAEEIDLIAAWIDQGAADAAGKKSALPVGARVRLHGTLDPAGGLDGLELVIDRGTRIDKNPRAGAYVQVRGVVREDGSVRVTRLRRR